MKLAWLALVTKQCVGFTFSPLQQILRSPFSYSTMGPSLPEVRQRLDALHDQIQELVAEAGSASLSIGVIHQKELVHSSHYGYRNLRTKEAPDDDTIYHLGSLSKALVTACLGVLVADGKLQWESRLLDLDLEPRFHQRNGDVESEATLLDLLAHRMGLAMRMNYWAQMQQELLLPPKEAINVLGDLNRLAEFRTTIKYNNWTYAVAVLLIEKITGKPLEEYMQDTFFKPLGLKRTTWSTPSEDNFANAHITLSDGTPFEVPSPRIGNGSLLCGAAGLKSTVHDLLILYDSLLSALEDQRETGLASTLGNPFKETVTLFTSYNKKGNTEYGLGWFLTELPNDIGWIGINDGRVKENPVIGRGVSPTSIAYHNGNMPGYISSVHLIPSTHTAIVILGNTLSFSDLPDYVGGLILNTILGSDDKVDFLSLVRECKASSINGPLRTAAQLESERKEGTSHKPLDAYVGRYSNAMGNLILAVSVSEDGDGLRMRLNGLPGTYYDLKHYHDDVFAWACDRDAEAKRAMFPQLSADFRRITFQAGEDGTIKSIFWIYARDEPKGEVFAKQA